MHEVVGDARRGLGAVDRLAFEFLQAELGGKQLGFDLGAQVAGPVSGFVGSLLEQILGFGEHGGEVVDELVAGAFERHGRLLGQNGTAGHAGAETSIIVATRLAHAVRAPARAA